MNMGDFVLGIIAFVLSVLVLAEGTYHFFTGTPLLFDIDYRFTITAGCIFLLLSIPMLTKLKETKN